VLTSIFAPIFVIGVLVLFHELGHFLAAKRAGIRVEAFSIGFGPSIVSWKQGFTVYRIAWIPFGGYVKMSGEEPSEGEEGADEPWRFHRKGVGARAGVLVAGPFANLVLAVLTYTLLFAIFGMDKIGTTRIAAVVPGSPAAEAGLRPGDTIVSVDGVRVGDWDELLEAMEGGSGGRHLSVMRGGEEIAIEVPAGEGKELGVGPDVDAVIGEVVRGGPADAAGLVKGDRVLAVGERPVAGWNDLRLAVERLPGEEVILRIRRGGETIEKKAVLDVVEEKGEAGEAKQVGRLQVAPLQERRRLGPLSALREGVAQTAWVVRNVFEFLKILFSGRVTADMVGGPVSIFHISGESARRGIDTLLSLLAFLSVELAILNLLPIPVLDGGHLVFLGIEAIRRRPLSVKQRTILQQIGLAVILLVMVTVTVFDVGRLLR
jgi:regulator of sigma E protease